MPALAIRDSKLPSPGGLMISPWVDLEMPQALHYPAVATDFLVTSSNDDPIW
jgi:hypothetical protein